MTNDHYTIIEQLDDLLDEEITGPAKERLLDHIASCSSCEAELADRLALRAEVAALPREIQPARDLWPSISARIEQSQGARTEEKVIPIQRARRFRQWSPVALAAAASLALVALSSGITAYLLRGEASAPIATVAPATVDSPSRATTALVAFQPAEQEYLATLDVLSAEFEARRSRLSPETVQTVEENLRLIDAAILEAREALAADPAGVDLPLLLSGVYRRKVELLQQAVSLTAET